MKNLNQLSIAILFAIIGIPICIAQPVSPKNQKYLAFTKTMNCSKCHMTKAARKGLAETSSRMVQNRPKLTFSPGLGQMPPKEPYLDRANRQVVRFKGQNGQNEVIFEVHRRSKSGQNDQNLRFRAWVWEALSRSSSPKAARKGPSRSLHSGPSKGSKMVKIRVKIGSLRVPPRSVRAVGLNRHILARAKGLGSGGLKMRSK